MSLSYVHAAVAAPWPIPLPTVTLRGRVVELTPLGEVDVAGIASAGADDRIWTFMTSDARTRERARAYVAELLSQWRSGSCLPFVARPVGHPTIIGATRLKNVVRTDRRMAIGSWFLPAAWGTGVNTEAKLLLLEHAFAQLGALRVELETDSRHARSLAAIRKLGATHEGTLRSHRIARDGHRRDSVIFSILDHEWPEARRRLRERVEESLRRVPTPWIPR